MLRELTYWDKMNQQWRMFEMKMYGKLYDVITSEKPKNLYNLLRDKFSTNKK